jgi:hypothetical protein
VKWPLLVLAAGACHHGNTPPPAPSCAKAAEHVLSLIEPKNEHAHDVSTAFLRRCTEDHWAPDVRSCIVSTVSLQDPKHCKERLPIPLRSHLDADLMDAAARARARDVPPSCADFGKTVEALVRCDQLPQATRDAIRQGYETMKGNWGTTDPHQREIVEEGCKAAGDALKQTGVGLGCAGLSF